MPHQPFELPFFSAVYPQKAVSTCRGLGSLRSSHGRKWSRTLVAPLQSRWPQSAYDLEWYLQSHSQPEVHRRPHSRNTFLPSRKKWDWNDQVETAFYLLKHHGTLRRAGGGRKVERYKALVVNYTNCIFFAYQYICSEKRVFVSTFLPFCPVSYWSQLVYGCVRVETRFYLFHGTRWFREDLGRYAPVTAAAVLTLNTIDIHWTMSCIIKIYRNSPSRGGQLF